MKTLTKNQQQKNQRPKSKQNVEGSSSINTLAATAQPEEELQSGYDSYYKQLSEEVETIERHVRELRQTPGLEDLTEDEAEEQIDFILRFSAWVFNQHLAEQLIATIDDVAELGVKSAKVQKPKGKSNKKVTESLSR
ncbi:hypothetical protein JAO76_07790 [Pontibacter sp. BT310]|uniref:NTP pyrophosphohydrolase MazG putative catalytic core domain-containing protein n=1 Tax=Pontibacter populi TaxID=890055 RepID=A0ABS6XAF1_9BACT|nr:MULTISPECIES: hypothetical protein [Pontibacter]MBJ6118086.1 hypothetical protein [Pontibacter sp. BT310]MBR0570513.1 hypothetical protein [Microvirga sp. STS03]MBW3364939.1 hypothetical protein [Pontibacter populi]